MESVEKISPVSPSKARKRKRQPGKWKHNCAKKLRYASPGLPIYPKCGHATKSFRCAALSMKQCLDFCHLYYENKDCAYQNVFLLKYCEVVPVARRRPSTSSHKRKKFQSKFFVRKNVLKIRLPLCQKAFLGILRITRSNVDFVMKTFLKKVGIFLKKNVEVIIAPSNLLSRDKR